GRRRGHRRPRTRGRGQRGQRHHDHLDLHRHQHRQHPADRHRRRRRPARRHLRRRHHLPTHGPRARGVDAVHRPRAGDGALTTDAPPGPQGAPGATPPDGSKAGSGNPRRRRKMKKKTTGIIAGAAGAALLMSGGTFALWSDSAEVPDTTITSGNLAVDVVASGCDLAGGDISGEAPSGTWQWVDTSSDRSDSPHWINANDFRIVPGDTIEGRIGLDLALEGENIVAQLGADFGDINQNGAVIQGFTVLNSDCEEIPLPSDLTLNLASTDNGNPGDATVVGATTDETADLTAVVKVSFPASIENQDHVQEQVLNLS